MDICRRKVAPIQIVENVLAPDYMITETYSFQRLFFPSKLEVLQWLAQRGLISNSRVCDRCKLAMSFIQCKKGIDGYKWKCKGCRKTQSVRDQSFFTRSHLSLEQLLIIVYCWSRNYTQTNIQHEARLGEGTTHTIVDWCSFFRDVCEQHLIDNPMVIGGLDEETLLPRVVEIDESEYFHNKYHLGQWRENHWVFGGVERGTGNCFLVEVPNRSSDTVATLIQRFIVPGTIIISNESEIYRDIRKIGSGLYEHEVLYKDKCIQPCKGNIYTRNAVNIWKRARRKLRRQFGTSEHQIQSHLHELIWRNKFKKNSFMSFLCNIREQYQFH